MADKPVTTTEIRTAIVHILRSRRDNKLKKSALPAAVRRKLSNEAVTDGDVWAALAGLKSDSKVSEGRGFVLLSE